jgi:photosystem II Psb27 protein
LNQLPLPRLRRKQIVLSFLTDFTFYVAAWVAKYRRERAVSGKSSYGNVYSAVNAVAGHYNNFGPTYPLPAKRKDRIFEELTDAEKQLARNR